ncbi:PepSY-associated TM helix domain-containing protein [Nitrospirillum pindoramense]|uniref:Putative iron-regulated membrane protein n=1 Tax=Nitrospirillum amazonense TaxID=28077 RepID=A0A560GZ31_9PROT|nr:PepSY domain-containing protein [Nitrospirillum amazonense]TWB39111.1 putative iron-regulated membrane protein [Nitrospirillum amazonense]
MSIEALPDPAMTASRRPWLDLRAVWRWHFYAGLFCIPFIVWLSLTGALYLFKPQVEALIDRPYDTLTITGPWACAADQARAGVAAVPGGVLNAYELPKAPNAATRVIVGRGTEQFRVYVHPQTLAILKVVSEDDRLMRIIFRLHGELMMGDKGSFVVEMAASWAIVMILTGLYLWWPRQADGLAGVLYPRLGRGRRTFWRDLHAVAGLWVSFFALFLLLSGLPWSKNWGAYFKEIRQITGTAVVKQDWTTGRSGELAERLAMNGGAAGGDEHAGHHGHAPAGLTDYAPLDALAATVAPLNLAPPVLISPPRQPGGYWTAKSDAQNRPLRTDLTLSTDGQLLKRVDFSQRHWVDRMVGIGVAAHEGHLFGWLNQALGVFTALSLITLAVSSVVLWLRRRPAMALGAPPATRASRQPARAPLMFATLLVALGVFLPLLGASLIVVLAVERLVLRRLPAARDWLGLPA